MRFLLGLLVAGGALASALPPEPQDVEVARLRRHFAAVLIELESREVSALTATQRAARARHIARLRAYAQQGVFPKNTDFAGSAVPYFVDRDATRCAMAYLIEQSGHGDYVRAVAARMNNALVGAIARDEALGPALGTWLDENGLTLAEAARIQPSYCSSYRRPPRQLPGFPPIQRSTTYYEENCTMPDGEAVLRFAGATSAMVLATLNLTGLSEGKSRQTTGIAGIVVGAVGAGLWFTYVMRPGDSPGKDGMQEFSYAAGILGGISVVSGVYALLTPGSASSTPAGGAQSLQVRAAPLLEPGRAGMALHVRF